MGEKSTLRAIFSRLSVNNLLSQSFHQTTHVYNMDDSIHRAFQGRQKIVAEIQDILGASTISGTGLANVFANDSGTSRQETFV